MDISDQLLSGFIKVGDLARGPRRDVVAYVTMGRFGKPDVEFQGGGILSLNATNLRTIANAWGTETNDWIGKELEMYVGKVAYQGQDMPSVMVRTISPPIPPKPKQQQNLPTGTPRGFHDDEIPF
jgi:hypothetical protein